MGIWRAMAAAYKALGRIQRPGRKLIAVSLFALLLFMQYSLWLEGTVGHWLDMRESNERQESENRRMRGANEQLSREIAALKNGYDMVEALAREELDMIRNDEIFFRFVDREPPKRRP